MPFCTLYSFSEVAFVRYKSHVTSTKSTSTESFLASVFPNKEATESAAREIDEWEFDKFKKRLEII